MAESDCTAIDLLHRTGLARLGERLREHGAGGAPRDSLTLGGRTGHGG